MIIGIKSKSNQNSKYDEKSRNFNDIGLIKKDSLTPSCPKAGLKPTPKLTPNDSAEKDKKIIINIQNIIKKNLDSNEKKIQPNDFLSEVENKNLHSEKNSFLNRSNPR
jgi:hypothetical protein